MKNNVENEINSHNGNIGEHKLNGKWVMWIHKIYNKSWEKDTYIKVHEFDTIESFWVFYNTIDNFTTNMFFLMRDGIFPRWEDESNVNGGVWSYIVQKHEVNSCWIDISIKTIGEILTDEEYLNDINGISLSPRTNVGIIKIWNSDKDKTYELHIDDKYKKDLRYEANENKNKNK